jgi:hypothetical protein
MGDNIAALLSIPIIGSLVSILLMSRFTHYFQRSDSPRPRSSRSSAEELYAKKEELAKLRSEHDRLYQQASKYKADLQAWHDVAVKRDAEVVSLREALNKETASVQRLQDELKREKGVQHST